MLNFEFRTDCILLGKLSTRTPMGVYQQTKALPTPYPAVSAIG